MVGLADRELEGVTTFGASWAESFRYTFSVQDGKLGLNLEGRNSKKQWCTGELSMSDWVKEDNAVPGSSVAEYAQCFQEALDCSIDQPGDTQRKLLARKGGKMRLELVLKLRMLRAEWSAKYTFDLEPVPVERIDVLESKLRDQQDELERLRRKHEADHVPALIQVQSTSKGENHQLRWNAVESDELHMTDGCVFQFLRAGTYQIGAVVNNQPASYDDELTLLKNRMTIQKACCTYGRGNYRSTVLTCATRVEKNDKLTVQCTCNLSGTSYLTLVRLGG